MGFRLNGAKIRGLNSIYVLSRQTYDEGTSANLVDVEGASSSFRMPITRQPIAHRKLGAVDT